MAVDGIDRGGVGNGERVAAPEDVIDSRPLRLGRRSRLVLLALIAVALALRFVTFPALSADGLRLASMDDYGHLRRAVATVRDFPRVPVFDPYLNHPRGGIWIWPPLFDVLIAAPARLFFGPEAEVEEVMLIAAVVPPFLGALSIVPLFFCVRSVFGAAEAWLAASFYSVLPAAVRYASFAHADQHAGEAAALIVVLAAFVGLLTAVEMKRTAVILAAVALATACLTWQGAVFLAPTVAAAARMAGRPRPAAAALIAAGLFVLPFAAAADGPITYVSFGLFQPIFLALVGAVLGLSAIPRWGVVLAALATLTVVLFWAPVGAGVRHLFSGTSGFEDGGAFYAYPREWLRLIAEYQPLFSGGWRTPLTQLSGGLLLVPVALALWVWRGYSDVAVRPAVALMGVTAIVVTGMALLQKRYVYYLAVIVALALATSTMALWRRRWRFLAVMVVISALLPAVVGIRQLAASSGAAGSDVFATLRRLAVLAPSPGDSLRPWQVAAGEVPAVLAPWSLGHLVTLLTGRPAGADNFGYGFDRQAQIYTAPMALDGEVAARLVSERFAYLVTTDLRPILGEYARAVGRGDLPVEQMLAVRVHESSRSRPLPFLELVLTSRSVWPTASGELMPRLKIYRVLPATEPSS